MQFNVIVVATDFSPGADAAFAQGLSLAQQHQARLLVVHVMPPLVNPSPLLDEMAVTQTTLALRDGLRRSCQEELQSRYLDRAQGVQAEILFLEGDPTRELVRLLKERGADLAVIGSTGVSGLAETVFGSVAQKLVRRAPCSVLVARPPAQPPA
ncbi:MAG: universal stress protein [Desulfarculus sp.]|jgi:nucleotide-binding universal stress UspA family protein|nr:MAG: universal stress protein [Desulfarculus sp.]